MVKVLDKNGQPLSITTRNGKVRRLLKDKKARVVNKDPFTIQLLYDIETEEFTMSRIIVTNDKRIPKDIMTEDSTIMDYGIFSLKINFIDLTTFELYFDVDGLDSTIYNYIKDSNLTKVTYFKFGTAFPIEEPILIVNAEESKPVDRYTESEVKFADDLITHGHIIIVGKDDSNRITLLTNIITQLKSKDVEIEFASPVLTDNYSITNIKSLAELTSNAQHEMMNRFKLMEQEQVNHVYKLKTYHKTKIIIINEFDKYMCSADYKSVDTIKSALGSLLRLGRAARIIVIVACQKHGCNRIPEDILNNFMNRICIDSINNDDDEISQLLFDKSINIHIPNGMGICSNASSNYSIFSIDAVKNFK